MLCDLFNLCTNILYVLTLWWISDMSFEVQDDTPQSTVGMRRQQRARRRWASSVLVEIRDAYEHHCARHHRNRLTF